MARNIWLELSCEDIAAFNCAVEDARIRDIAVLLALSDLGFSCDIDDVMNDLSDVREELGTSPDIIREALDYCAL